MVQPTPLPKFQVEQDDEGSPVPSNAPEPGERIADILLLLLKPLTQRTIIALASLYSLATCASVFFLAYLIIPFDTVFKLVALSIYAVFVLAINVIAGHRK